MRLEVSSKLCSVARCVGVHFVAILRKERSVDHKRWCPELAHMLPSEFGNQSRLVWTTDQMDGRSGLGWGCQHVQGVCLHTTRCLESLFTFLLESLVRSDMSRSESDDYQI